MCKNLKIFQHRNARRIIARLSSDGSIRITVPLGFNIEQNQHIIQELVEKLEQKAAKESERKSLFQDGSIIKIEGITFYINHAAKETHTISASISRKNELIAVYIHVPNTLSIGDLSTEKRISNLMIRIAGKAASSMIVRRAEQVSHRIGMSPSQWKIGRGHRTLGTCHIDRSITLSAVIAFLPPELQEFVICHELAHLSEMNHSERFHSLCNNYLCGRENELNKRLKNYTWPIRR